MSNIEELKDTLLNMEEDLSDLKYFLQNLVLKLERFDYDNQKEIAKDLREIIDIQLEKIINYF